MFTNALYLLPFCIVESLALVVRQPTPPVDIAHNTLSLNRYRESHSRRGLDLDRRQSSDLDNTGVAYVTPVRIGNQEFDLLVDTGSSDTWIYQENLECLNNDNYPCSHGPGYQLPGTFKPIPNFNLSISYFDGCGIQGPLGHDAVILGGIEVKDQIIGLGSVVKQTNGNTHTSGILGMGYRALTALVDNDAEREYYDPIFTTMIRRGLVKKAQFSLAVDEKGGILGLGGIPQGIEYDDSRWASTPIIPIQLETNHGSMTVYERYNISLGGFSCVGCGDAHLSGPPYAIVDSGYTLTKVPPAIAKAVNSGFSNGTWISSTYYQVDCDVNTIPRFGVIIDGQHFWHNPKDMVVNLRGTCFSAIASTSASNDEPITLGDPFLKQVLAVFDIGAGNMYFAPTYKGQ